MIWDALLEFLLRLAFGLGLGLLVTPNSLVPAGFFRVHLWVLLGMYTLAALFTTNWSVSGTPRGIVMGGCIAAAVACYVGSVIWLYERAKAGFAALIVVLLIGGGAMFQAATAASERANSGWAIADAVSSSLLLGFVMAAMLLGHWYLNSPGMQLGPLRRLLVCSAASVLLRAALCGLGLFLVIRSGHQGAWAFWATIGLRWLAGLVGVGALLAMTWQTLKIPNTQSATGILYVAVIFSFLGELGSQLVSMGLPYPL